MISCFLIDPDQGSLFVVDGIGKPKVWNGQQDEFVDVGLSPPLTAVTLAGIGTGTIVGTYWGYVRFLDANGYPSNLSPISAEFAANGTAGVITGATSNTPIVITSAAHGLITGNLVKIEGVGGVGDANDTWTITVIDANSFSLDNSSSDGLSTYTGGGTWVAGLETIVYTNVPVPTETKVVRRQILRNTDGQATTFYVDVDTTDITATSFASTLTDSLLQAGTAVPLLDSNNFPLANSHDKPPTIFKCIQQQLDRMFMAGLLEYNRGACSVTLGSPTVTGVGTGWKSTMADRFLYVDGASRVYEIDSIDETAQTLTLTDNYVDSTNLFATYSIKPPPAYRRVVQFCCDTETEILTQRGWLRYDEVKLTDKALSLNAQTNQIEWDRVLAVNKFPFQGKLNYWHNNKFSAMSTDNHRWIARGSGMQGNQWTPGRTKDAVHFATTEQVNKTPGKMLITGGGIPVSASKASYSDEFVELAGWFITEGSIKKRGFGVMIGQSISHNPDYVERIRKLREFFDKDGETATECKQYKDMALFYFGKGIGKRLRDACPNKALLPEFLCKLTAEQLDLLYQTMMDGDGCRIKGSRAQKFAQKLEETVQGFQMLCAMLGKRTNRRYRVQEMRGKMFSWNEVSIYLDQPTKAERLVREKVDYDGIVWCPTTKNQTWMARRNGFTYWTGNSPPGEPQSWPPFMAFSLQETGDEITALFQMGPYLFIAEKAHLHKFTFSINPLTDGAAFMVANRGAINQRCIIVVDATAYMLDELGVYAFMGNSQVASSSADIQSVFRKDDSDFARINWRWKEYFHASLDRQREVIRWFVSLDGNRYPSHALCYQYRDQRWWVEQLPMTIGGTCVGYINGSNGTPQSYYGGQFGRIYAASTSSLDCVDPTAGDVRSTVTSASSFTLTDANASWPTSGMVNAPVAIVHGMGKGQVRRIVSVSGSTLNLDSPWSVLPDTTSVYQLGGIHWTYRSAWLRLSPSETTPPRRFEMLFEPLESPAIADLRFFSDFSGDADVQAVTKASKDGGGIESTKGLPDLSVDLTRASGLADQQLPSHKEYFMAGKRYVQYELSGWSNQEQVRIFQLLFEGTLPRSQAGA